MRRGKGEALEERSCKQEGFTEISPSEKGGEGGGKE